MRWIPWVIMIAACGGTTDKGAVQDDGSDDTGGSGNVLVYVDADQDGVLAEDDCDDNDWQVYPGAEEICDGKDNDCNGEIDEGFDGDGDGALPMDLCVDGTDCNDADPSIPVEEIPYDGVDQDCDGQDLTDVDGDGFDALNASGNDCDDEDSTVHPGATEIAKDGIDQDCNGVDLLDGDLDGFDDVLHGGADCDDSDLSVNPDAIDWMNDGIDSDCDDVDGGFVSITRAHVQFHGTLGEYDLLGQSVQVCDLDNDDLPDLVITAPYAGGFDGGAGIFYGRYADEWHASMTLEDADTFVASDAPVVGFGVACGDVTGDGYEDLLIGQGELHFGTLDSNYAIRIFSGFGGMYPGEIDLQDAETTLQHVFSAPGGIGTPMAPAFAVADLDGDGAAEIIVDMDEGDAADGYSAIWIVPGGDLEGDLFLNATASQSIVDAQGDTVSALGATVDLDSSGPGNDLFVGQSLYRAEGSTGDGGDPSLEEDPIESPLTGRVSFINLADLTTVGIGETGADSQTVADAGYLAFTSEIELGIGAAGVVADIDGDGQPDGLFGAPLSDDGDGALYYVTDLSGLASGGSSEVDVDATMESRVLGTEAGGLGTSVAVGSSVRFDGSVDIMVTEPDGAGSLGAVWLLGAEGLFAGDNAVEEVAVLGIIAQYPTDNIGSTLAMADFDGDGRDDLLIASDQHASPGEAGLVPTGRVSLFLSSRF